MITGRASSSIIFLIPRAFCFRLKNRSYPGLMNRRFRSRYLIRFNARKIYDIVDLDHGISPREKTKIEKLLHFREIFTRYLIDDWSISNKDSRPFQKCVDLLSFQRYYIQKVKLYYPISYLLNLPLYFDLYKCILRVIFELCRPDIISRFLKPVFSSHRTFHCL